MTIMGVVRSIMVSLLVIIVQPAIVAGEVVGSQEAVEMPVALVGDIGLEQKSDLAKAVTATERMVTEATIVMDEARGRLFDENTTKKDDEKSVVTIIAQNAIIVQAEQQLKKMTDTFIKKAEDELIQEDFLSRLIANAKDFGVRLLARFSAGYGKTEEEKENAPEIIKGLLEQQNKITQNYGLLLKIDLASNEQAQLKDRYRAVIAQLNDAIYEQQLITGDVMSTQRKVLLGAAAAGTAAGLALAKQYFDASPENEVSKAGPQILEVGGIPTSIKPSEVVTSEVVTSEVVTPEVVTPEVVTPEVVTPEVVTPEVVIPETVTPETVTPETVTPEVVTPEVVTPEVVIPEVVTPEVVIPETVTPETEQQKEEEDNRLAEQQVRDEAAKNEQNEWNEKMATQYDLEADELEVAREAQEQQEQEVREQLSAKAVRDEAQQEVVRLQMQELNAYTEMDNTLKNVYEDLNIFEEKKKLFDDNQYLAKWRPEEADPQLKEQKDEAWKKCIATLNMYNELVYKRRAVEDTLENAEQQAVLYEAEQETNDEIENLMKKRLEVEREYAEADEDFEIKLKRYIYAQPLNSKGAVDLTALESAKYRLQYAREEIDKLRGK